MLGFFFLGTHAYLSFLCISKIHCTSKAHTQLYTTGEVGSPKFLGVRKRVRCAGKAGNSAARSLQIRNPNYSCCAWVSGFRMREQCPLLLLLPPPPPSLLLLLLLLLFLLLLLPPLLLPHGLVTPPPPPAWIKSAQNGTFSNTPPLSPSRERLFSFSTTARRYLQTGGGRKIKKKKSTERRHEVEKPLSQEGLLCFQAQEEAGVPQG